MIATWSVNCLGRSLQDLNGSLAELPPARAARRGQSSLLEQSYQIFPIDHDIG